MNISHPVNQRGRSHCSFYRLLSTTLPHCAGMSSHIRHLITVTIKTHRLCLQANLHHIGGGRHSSPLMRFSTKTAECLFDISGVCNDQLCTGVAPRLACCCDMSCCSVSQINSGQKRQAAMWLLAVQRQRKQSRSNIKNDSSNYPPCAPRDAISHMCVHPRTCLCVCVHSFVCVGASVCQQACRQCFICSG